MKSEREEGRVRRIHKLHTVTCADCCTCSAVTHTGVGDREIWSGTSSDSATCICIYYVSICTHRYV